MFPSGAVCSLRVIRQREGRWAEVRMREGKIQIGKWKTQPRGALNQCLSKQAVSVSLSRHVALPWIAPLPPCLLTLALPDSLQFIIFTLLHALCKLIDSNVWFKMLFNFLYMIFCFRPHPTGYYLPSSFSPLFFSFPLFMTLRL